MEPTQQSGETSACAAGTVHALGILCCIALATVGALTVSTAQGVASYVEETDGVLCSMTDGKNLKLQVCDANIIRVVYTPSQTIPAAQNHMVSRQSFDPGNWTSSESAGEIAVQTSRVKAVVSKSTGAVTFLNSGGTVVLAEKPGSRTMTATTNQGVPAYSGNIEFDSPLDEGIYGFGQYQNGRFNQRDATLRLSQGNTEDIMPFFMSTRGYGVLFSLFCSGIKDPPLKLHYDWLYNDAWDYFFVYGPELDSVVAAYRSLTGQAPMFPKWAYGFWQCKNRYEAQDQVFTAIQTYRDLQIPIDNLVQDWQWWRGSWGSYEWNTTAYPNPEGMISALHNTYNCHFTISCWPSFEEGNANYDLLSSAGYLTTSSSHGYNYDVLNPGAGQAFWSILNNSLFSIGTDGWWLDATEPEGEFWNTTTAEGPSGKVVNIYPLLITEHVAQGQRSVTSDKRVVILTRSMYGGMQRNASIYWTGDILGNMDVFRAQVPGLLNTGMSGLPYSCTDIGGFIGATNESLIRWFQAGTFFPIFRIHGTRDTELWASGQQFQDIATAFDKLRYRLMPYIYSLGWKVTSESYTMMRGLAFDFRNDPNVRDISDQFMFGPSLMICPVVQTGATTRDVYLPAGRWYDFWTGARFDGGRTIAAEAPIERMPIFVRGGSVLPMGPDLQWATEKPADPIEVRVYPGADGAFALYEDENDNYNYENGTFATIPIRWDDGLQTLSIGERSGSFPGMLSARAFRVVLVEQGHGIGAEHTADLDGEISYDGRTATWSNDYFVLSCGDTLSLTTDGSVDPLGTVTITNQSARPLPALSAACDSSWCVPSVSGTGANQAITTVARVDGKTPGIYLARVRVTGQNFSDAVYVVKLRVNGVPVPRTIDVLPGSLSLATGKTAQFSATVVDGFGDPFTGGLVWSVSGGGTIDPNGLFTSSGEKGIFTISVHAQGFDQPSATAQVEVADHFPGLHYVYYEGVTNSVDGVSGLTMRDSGTTPNFSISRARVSTNFAFVFTGYISIPSDGSYTFYTSSDDGSNLIIDSALVVNNDGVHAPVEVSGGINLTEGLHRISATFFQGGGGMAFSVQWEGPGMAKQEIPDSLLVTMSGNSATMDQDWRLAPESPGSFALSAGPSVGGWGMVVRFRVPPHSAQGGVCMQLLDIRGKVVRTLVDGTVEPGDHAITLNAPNRCLAAGQYFCRMRAEGFDKTTHLILVQ